MEGIAFNKTVANEQLNVEAKTSMDGFTKIPEIGFEDIIAEIKAEDINKPVEQLIASESIINVDTQKSIPQQTNIDIKTESLLLLQESKSSQQNIDITIDKQQELVLDQQKQDLDKVLDETNSKGAKISIKTTKEFEPTKIETATTQVIKTEKTSEAETKEPEKFDIETIETKDNKTKTAPKQKSQFNNEKSQSAKIDQKNTEPQTTIKSASQHNGDENKNNNNSNNNQQNNKNEKNSTLTTINSNGDNSIKDIKDQEELKESNNNNKTPIRKDNSFEKGITQVTHKNQAEQKVKTIEQTISTTEKMDTEPKAQKVSEQIVDSVRKNLPFSGANKNYQINLNPRDMGEVNVKMQIAREGIVKASFIIEEFKTFDLLQQNTHALQKSLEDAGYKVEKESLNFSMRQQNSENNNENDNNQKNKNSAFKIYEHEKGLLGIQEVSEQLIAKDNHPPEMAEYQININIKA